MSRRTQRGTEVLASAWRGWRNVPVLVRAATGAFFGLMLAMLFLYPVNYGVDEAAHFDLSYAYSQGHGVYAPGTRFIASGIIGEQGFAFLGAPPHNSFADSEAPARSERLSIGQYGGDAPTAVADQMTQHPPLYYLLGAGILSFPGVSDLPYDVQFTLLRLLSMVLLVSLPLLFWKTARQLGAGSLAPAAALIPLMIPGLARSGASVTNDSLLILAFGVVMSLLARVVTGDASRRTAVWVAAWILIALLTKGFALQLPAVALIAYLVCWRRTRSSVVAPLLVVAGGSALGAIWWLHNLIAYGRVQPNGYPAGYNDEVTASLDQGPGHLVGFVRELEHVLISRFWGGLGLLEPPQPNFSFAYGATVVLFVSTVAGLAYGIGHRYGRAAAGAMVLPSLFTLGIVAVGAWPQWAHHSISAGMQGRYLYPVLIGVSAVAMVGIGRLMRGRATRLVAPALVTSALFTQLWSLHQVLLEWWYPRTPQTHTSSYRATLAALLAWSPWPVGVSAMVGVVILGVAARVIYAAVRRPFGGVSSALSVPVSPDRQGSELAGHA